MRILLLADESITVQRVIALTFAKEPVQVVAVFDGRQALEVMATRKPDIILAGTSLPNLDGYDLAREVRNSPELRQTPVLLLSGAFELVDEARLKSSGANGVIEKPVEPTVVIRRVKELLGLKTDETPATSGRLVTSAGGVGDRKLPPSAPPPSVTSTRPAPSTWDELRSESGLAADAPSVEGQPAPPRSGHTREAFDAALESLDQHISGRTPPAPPPAEMQGWAAEPPSPSDGNPVFEVDAEWFASEQGETLEHVRVERVEIVEDLQTIEFAAPPAPQAPVFEVDDKWFAEAEKARADNLVAREALADEMGVNDRDLPGRTAPAESPSTEAAEPESATTHEPIAEFVAHTVPVLEEEVRPPVLEALPPQAEALSEPAVAAAPPSMPHTRDVADDFAALLAYEQGGPDPGFGNQPPAIPLPALGAAAVPAAPVITEEALDSIAERVAARLNSSLGEQWREVMAAAVRDTVRSVVSETSERLIREEIDRIKNNKA